MPFWVRDASSWKPITKAWVRDAAAWKEVKSGWVRDAGVWKLFYNALSFLVGTHTISGVETAPGTAFATVTFRNTGALDYNTSDLGSGTFPGEWMDPLGGDTPGNYSVRATEFSTSGTATRTGTTGSWLQLNVDRSWQISTTSLGTKSWGLTLEVRRDSDSTIVATGSATLEVEAI